MRDDNAFYRKADGAEIEVRLDRFGGIQVTVVKTPMLKHLHLTHEQAAAIRDGLTYALGEAV